MGKKKSKKNKNKKEQRKPESKKWKVEILSAIISTAVATPRLGMCTVLVLVCIVE